jgi:ATP-dependent protease ClpP protease subunit
MDRIDINAPDGVGRERFFARSIGTKFAVTPSANTIDATEIELYDEIGFWGVNAKDFRAKLKGAGDVVLKINSPGGSVFDGIAIYNDLKAHKGNVRVEITGIAASIASIIAMAGNEIAIAENAMMMIHNAWTVAIGNAEELSAQAAVLSKIDGNLALTYAAQKGTPGIRAIKQMMADETWMTGKEAKDNGFATEILKPADKTTQAKFDLSVFENTPEALAYSDEDEPKTVRDAERALRDAGWSRTEARKVFSTREDNAQRDAVDEKPEMKLEALQAAIASLNKIFQSKEV